jgi:hypothetical protein
VRFLSKNIQKKEGKDFSLPLACYFRFYRYLSTFSATSELASSAVAPLPIRLFLCRFSLLDGVIPTF